MVKVKEKYFKTKYRPASILLNFSARSISNFDYILNSEIIKIIHL